MLVPKLRFREFNDEWQKSKLISVSQIFKGNGLSKNDLSKDGKDCILYGELYTNYGEIIKDIKSKTNKNSKVFVLSKYNDVIIPSSGETPIDIAKASCVLKSNVILGGDLNIIRLNDIDGRFLSYEFNSKLKLELANLSQGHSIVHLYGEKFKNIEIKFPCKEEQKKIANTIELLNKKIELQSQKVEALKLYKIGLDNIIFSDVDSTCIIGNLIKEYNERTNRNNQHEILSSTMNGILVQSKYFNKQAASEDTTGYKIVPNGFITYRSMSDTGEFHFNIQNVIDNGIVSPAYPVFMVTNDVDKVYFTNYLNNNKNFKSIILSKKEGGTRYALSLFKLKEISIQLPSKPKQIYYGHLLELYDKKLFVEINKMNKLEELKKGLMQKMFV